MLKEIVKRTLRVPVDVTVFGNGAVMARQLDSSLMKAGFKLSRDLLAELSSAHPSIVQQISNDVLDAVRELVGDHREHNVYFRDFPENVPNTVEFWLECIVDALKDPRSAGIVSLQLAHGEVNLLDLPKYGKYQHSYDEVLVAHAEFMPSLKDRMTVLHLGKTLPEETHALYISLAESRVPVNDESRELLKSLTECCLNDEQPEKIPVRENKAIINHVRLVNRFPIIADTVTDILRLACSMSDGDVTLDKVTKFMSFPRTIRKALMSALDDVVALAPEKLSDVNQYSERWKRLGERLHPHEYNQFPDAQDVFHVARGDKKAKSLAARAEIAFMAGEVREAVSLLTNAPGMFFRCLDRILRSAHDCDLDFIMGEVYSVLPKVSSRVILSLREHLESRLDLGTNRIFSNTKGKTWVTKDVRLPLDEDVVDRLQAIFDDEILSRLPARKNLLIDPEILRIAVPASDKNKSNGFGIMPRGSVSELNGDTLRFFIYWKQHHERTDYDLSVLMLDENFAYAGQTSWTNLRNAGGTTVHSGDITDASNGASEFIDIDLKNVRCKYVIPQVNVFSGEGFNEAEEAFFGFMERDREANGMPFEARAVRMKSDLRGKGKIALPLVFIRDGDGMWTAKWLHIYLNGHVSFNRVESNKVSTGMIARAFVERDFLNVQYIVDLLRFKAKNVDFFEKGEKIPEPVTFIGLEVPEGLPEGSKVYTLSNLHELIP